MILERVKAIISHQVGTDESEITPETNFREDLDADSLDLFQIVNDIEDEFHVEIEEAEVILTVNDIIQYVEKQLDKPTKN